MGSFDALEGFNRAFTKLFVQIFELIVPCSLYILR